MTTWDERRLICIHGVREGLDYHDCSKCKKMAEDEGKTWRIPNQTYIYTKKKS